MHIAVIGAGAWGTALAVHAAKHHAVTLLARDSAQAQLMQSQRVNARYLAGIALPNNLQVCSLPPEPPAAASQQAPAFDLYIIATPLAGLADQLQRLASQQIEQPVVWLCKGLSKLSTNSGALSGGQLPHEIAVQVAPHLQVGVLTGPSFAQEVARGQPTALVAASIHPAVIDTLIKAFHFDSVRLYGNTDITGAEIGGAVKNILAIAVGLCDGLQLGLNARAALITRGLSEMTRFGLALGAKAETLMGLTGLGDLILTATGDLSRNRKVGLLLAQGLTLDAALATLGHVAEGVNCAMAVAHRAKKLHIDMPITQAVTALLEAKITATQAVAQLMGRESKRETQA